MWSLPPRELAHSSLSAASSCRRRSTPIHGPGREAPRTDATGQHLSLKRGSQEPAVPGLRPPHSPACLKVAQGWREANQLFRVRNTLTCAQSPSLCRYFASSAQRRSKPSAMVSPLGPSKPGSESHLTPRACGCFPLRFENKVITKKLLWP